MNKTPRIENIPHAVLFRSEVHCVELSPYEWSHNVILIAFSGKLSVGCIRFKEENEQLEKECDIQLVHEFPLGGRAQALALSQETLIKPGSSNVIQCACAATDFKIYLFQSGFSEDATAEIMEGHSGYINSITFSKESSTDFIASVSDDLTCKIWSVKDVTCKTTFDLTSPGMSVKWSWEDPNKILVAEKVGIIRLYNIALEQPVLSFETDVPLLMSVDWSHYNINKVAGVAGGCLYVWDITRPSYPIHKRHIHPSGAKDVRFSFQSENVVATVGSNDPEIVVSNIVSKYPVHNEILNTLATNVTWHYKLPYVCTGIDNYIILWKIPIK